MSDSSPEEIQLIKEIAREFFDVQEIFILKPTIGISVCIIDKIISLDTFKAFDEALRNKGYFMDRFGCDWQGSGITYNTITIKGLE